MPVKDTLCAEPDLLGAVHQGRSVQLPERRDQSGRAANRRGDQHRQTVYAAGRDSHIDVTTQFAGKAVAAHLTVSVVDEMVYALQPEVAPTIDQFFYHPRRNNVRTSASLSFISYDVALPGSPGAPGKANRSERGVKVLERPRREDVDTAAWQPELLTDAERQNPLHLQDAGLADPLAHHCPGHRR
jgi:hypothetical protein